MSAPCKISDSEWKVMKAVWALAPCSADDIIQALLRESSDWHPRTIKTFLNRLVSKKILGFEREGRTYLYHPLATEKECVAAASESFLDRVFGGSLEPMLAHFVQRKKLSAKEIEDLKKLLEKGKR